MGFEQNLLGLAYFRIDPGRYFQRSFQALRPLRHYHPFEPVRAAHLRQNFLCFQRGLPEGCEPLRRGRAAISVSEWPLVSGRANRADFGSVGDFPAFSMTGLATPPKLPALFPSLSRGTETKHARGAGRGVETGLRVAERVNWHRLRAKTLMTNAHRASRLAGW